MRFHAPKTPSPSKRKALPIKYFVVFTRKRPRVNGASVVDPLAKSDLSDSHCWRDLIEVLVVVFTLEVSNTHRLTMTLV